MDSRQPAAVHRPPRGRYALLNASNHLAAALFHRDHAAEFNHQHRAGYHDVAIATAHQRLALVQAVLVAAATAEVTAHSDRLEGATSEFSTPRRPESHQRQPRAVRAPEAA